jgi:hypothetical protein
VDRAVLDDLWQEICTYRRTRVDDARTQRRLLSHRTAAELETLRLRSEELASLTPAEPGPAVDEIPPRLAEILDALVALAPVSSPAALALADEFETVAALPDVSPEELDAIDLNEIESRVATARVALAGVAARVGPEARATIEARHRAVVAAESALFEARRKDREEALVTYQRALAAEHAALDEAGVDSYVSFLLATARGEKPTDMQVRLRAELELRAAEAELSTARAALAARGIDRNERLLELRARAAQLLGHFPADDAPAELRALVVENPDAKGLRAELGAILVDAGEEPGDDVVARAIDVIEAHASRHVSVFGDLAAAPDANDDGFEERFVLAEDMARLTAERDDLEHTLLVLERELEWIDRVRKLPVPALPFDALELLLTELLECYRAGDLLAGRLPLVLDAALDELEAASVDGAAKLLATAADVQVIVVTADPEMSGALADAGATTVPWPDQPSHAPRGPESGPGAATRAPGTKCATHPDTSSTSACAQCDRPACLDCLVYVPGEPELWCVDCADAIASRNLRLLRRRGA